MKQQLRRDMILSAALIRRKVFELKMGMIDDGVTPDAKMQEAQSFFKVRMESYSHACYNGVCTLQKEDFSAVLEERACSNMCGYPCCAQPVSTSRTKTEATRYCCDSCLHASRGFQAKLSDEYVSDSMLLMSQ